MKFDKDTILKQRFWFLLALAVPLTLAAFFILMTAVRAEIARHRAKLEGDLKSAASGGDIKNDKWVKQMEDKAQKMAKEEETVWRDAFESQRMLYTWPEEIERKFHFTDGLFATEIKAESKGPPNSAKSDDSHFYGVIKTADQNELKVEGTVDKKLETITFQRTAKVKVTIDNKDTDFASLQKVKGGPVAITFLKGKYFFDPLTDPEQEDFITESGYRSQIREILEQVNPVNDKGEGIVQLGNWPYPPKQGLPPANAAFLRYVAGEWNKKLDISDEAWMAQEDLWVQREMYRIIGEANDSVSKFSGTGGDAKGKTYTFTNPYWELSLTFAGPKKLGVKIKNLLPRRQRLDLDFMVQLQKTAKRRERIPIGGEPLGPLKSCELKEHDVEGQAATGIYGVEQIINWETAAVKRIDHISFGSLLGGDCSHGHRTFPEGLKPFREQKAAAPPPQQGPGPGPDPKMSKMPMDKGKGEADANLTPNGLRPNRYIEPPTRQTRRIPVGVALIVDQEHVDRVLLAFSKSSLRFLTTQVILNRYPHSVRPQVGPVQPGSKGGFNPMGIGEGTLGPGGFGRQQPPPSTGAEQESNVELVVYGIVTLYARYPPRAQTP